MLRAYRTEIIVAVIAALCIAAAFFLGRFVDARDAYTCDDQGTITCTKGYYRALIDKEGAIFALQDLKIRHDAGGAARTFCHPLLHVIGEAAGKEFKSVSKAYLYGETFCRSGYYHGVLEGIFGEESKGELLGKLNTFCADTRGKNEYSYDYFSCVHGIGHGLMAYLDHDLFESLKGCDRLTGAWEQSSCYGGVFMENVISDSGEMPSRFLKKDDALYPCTTVGEKYRYQCYLMQTSHVLSLNGGDFESAFTKCTGVESAYRVACFQSLGRDASGWSYGEIETARAYCELGKTDEAREQCLIGAAVDLIQSEGIEKARMLCEVSDAAIRDTCLAAIAVHARTMQPPIHRRRWKVAARCYDFVMSGKKRGAPRRRQMMWGIIAGTIIAGGFAYSAGMHSGNISQVAVGIAADLQCLGNYDPTYQWPKINPKTKKQGLLGKPCEDTTSGHITKGTCQAMGKCKGESTGGMMPMLPMLPMPMPKMGGMPMGMPMPNCTASSTSESPRDPSCPPESTSGGLSGLSSWLFGGSTDTSTTTESNTQSTSGSAWSRLLVSLGIMTEETPGASDTSNTEAGTNVGASQSNTVTYGGSGSVQLSSGGSQSVTTQADANIVVSADLSTSPRQPSTFSYAGNSTFTENTATTLSSVASTLRRMLDMIRGWTQW